MDIQSDGYTWPMDIPGISKDIACIYQAYVGGLHILGTYQAYSRHIQKIGVPNVHCRAGMQVVIDSWRTSQGN